MLGGQAVSGTTEDDSGAHQVAGTGTDVGVGAVDGEDHPRIGPYPDVSTRRTSLGVGEGRGREVGAQTGPGA